MSVTTRRPLGGRFRTDLVLLTVLAVTQRVTSNLIFPGKAEPQTGGRS